MDDRCSELGIAVVLSMRERDAWVEQCERRVGEALSQLVEGEGLSVREAVRWCVGAVTMAEVTRLRRLASATSEEGAEGLVGGTQ